MKLPFVEAYQLESLSTTTCRVIFDIAACGVGWKSIEDIAIRLNLDWRTVKRALITLSNDGLIQLHWRGAGRCWTSLKVVKRFTWVPSLCAGSYARLSGRSVKLFWTICRGLDNSTKAMRFRLETLASRIGRSIRTVQLGLCELKGQGLLSVIRTGRSNWYMLERGVDEPCPEIAPRARLGLRLLSSTTMESLYRGLRTLREKAERIARTALCPLKLTAEQQSLRWRLTNRGWNGDDAQRIVYGYDVAEVRDELSRPGRRRSRFRAVLPASRSSSWPRRCAKDALRR